MSFKQSFKDMQEMSHVARAALSHVGITRDIRDKIMNETKYANWSKPLVSVEYKSFREIIDIYHGIREGVIEIYPLLDPSWLIQIIETYIEFLKKTPQNTVPIFELLLPIIVEKQYLTRDKYPTWVNRFIKYHFRPVELEQLMQARSMTDEMLVGQLQDSGITVDSDIGKGITRFIDKVVDILSDVFDKMISIHKDKPTASKHASLTITAVIQDMIPIFRILFKLNSRYADAPLMQHLTFNKMLKLDSELKKELKKQGGGLTRKRRSNKKRSNKKRT